ncbi:MAG: hypothetical protein ABSB59_20945, partial [Streptosporangiaceae bacterium]
AKPLLLNSLENLICALSGDSRSPEKFFDMARNLFGRWPQRLDVITFFEYSIKLKRADVCVRESAIWDVIAYQCTYDIVNLPALVDSCLAERGDMLAVIEDKVVLLPLALLVALAYFISKLAGFLCRQSPVLIPPDLNSGASTKEFSKGLTPDCRVPFRFWSSEMDDVSLAGVNSMMRIQASIGD